jgi:hypothetical protein
MVFAEINKFRETSFAFIINFAQSLFFLCNIHVYIHFSVL